MALDGSEVDDDDDRDMFCIPPTLCWTCSRHPWGIARDKVDGPVAVVRNARCRRCCRVVVAAVAPSLGYDLRSLLSRSYLVG